LGLSTPLPIQFPQGLTLERSKTVDEEISAKVIDFNRRLFPVGLSCVLFCRLSALFLALFDLRFRSC
jgi:hypothetical protein